MYKRLHLHVIYTTISFKFSNLFNELITNVFTNDGDHYIDIGFHCFVLSSIFQVLYLKCKSCHNNEI